MVIDGPSSTQDEALEAFTAARGRIFGIAYRLTGRTWDAEDVVQETWLRWQRQDRANVRDPGAFLAMTAHNLAINELTCARARHERSMDEKCIPVVDDEPTRHVERSVGLESAASRLIERLTPPRRAAFILRVGFDYPYERIAELLATSTAGARQLVSRARRDLLERPAQPAPGDAAHRHLLRELVFACRDGDLERLEDLLRRDLGVSGRRSSGRVRRVHAD